MVYQNKNGEIPVRKIADKVINSYRDLIYSHKQIDEERAELNYAEKQALQEIPHIREKINKAEVERERSIRLIDELREKYNKERDTLVSGKGGIETLLKQVHEKRLHYEQINIEEIIKRVAQEGLQNGELARISAMKEELTRAYQDVLSKYSSLFKNLDADLSLFENNKQTQILEKDHLLPNVRRKLWHSLALKRIKCGRRLRKSCKRWSNDWHNCVARRCR